MGRQTVFMPGLAIFILLVTFLANPSLASVHAGSAGTISASTNRTPGALGSIVMITVADPDLAAGNSNLPQVIAAKVGVGLNVIVPVYQTSDHTWVGFIRTTSLTFFDPNGNGVLDDVNPSVIIDLDDSGTFSAGDTVITGPILSAGTNLAVIQTPATNTGSQSNAGKFADANRNGRYEAGEAIYQDQDGSGTVSAGDKRLVAVGSFPAGSLVTVYDPDLGTNLTRFNMESRPASPPKQDTTAPTNGFRNAPPYIGEPDLSIVDIGAIVVSIPGVAVGDSIIVTYNDADPPVSTSTNILRMVSQGTVSFNNPSYNLFSQPSVTVTDPDINLDPTKSDSLSWKGANLLTIKTSSNPAGVATLASETGTNTGIFTAEFTVGPAGTSAAMQGFEVKLGDMLTADYADPNIATNADSPHVTATASIVTNTGSLSFDRTNYNITDTATLSLSDPDLNVHPDAVDQWKSTDWSGLLSPGGAIRVTSTTDPIGLVLSPVETGQNTGIFTATLNFTSGNTSKATLKTASGDVITATYKDWIPAGIQNNQLGAISVDVKATAAIPSKLGSKVYPIRITGTESLDGLNVPKSIFSSAETMIAAAATQNRASVSTSILITIQITDPERTVYPTHFVKVALTPSQPFTFRPSFTVPKNAKTGTWQFEVNVFDKFPAEGGVPLAQAATQSFIVS